MLEAPTLRRIIAIQRDIVRQGLDLAGVMALVTRELMALVDADGTAIELAEGEAMVYRAAAGLAEASLGLRLDRHRSLSGLCVAEDRALRCDDTESDDRVDRDACRRVGIRSMVVVPLRHQATVVGALKAMGRNTAAFDADDLEVMALLAGIIGDVMFYASRSDAGDLFHRATHDSLTGLPNRALFADRLHAALARLSREGTSLGLLSVDLDGFKAVNDQHGHAAGDAVLVAVARAVERCARQGDTVARLGGDEFGVLLAPPVQQADLERIAARIRDAVRRPVHHDRHALQVGASLGGVLAPQEGTAPEALLHLADQRMYAAKRQGRLAAAEGL